MIILLNNTTVLINKSNHTNACGFSGIVFKMASSVQTLDNNMTKCWMSAEELGVHVNPVIYFRTISISKSYLITEHYRK